ncbi:MAG: hypothetical protein R3F61_04115 [Myxococcota bacterium]
MAPHPEITIPQSLPVAPLRGFARRAALALLVLGLAGSGCVRVYQPMSGLHRPKVIDVRAANFQDLHLTIRCVPGGLLSRHEASMLCQKVTTLFQNQGALVHTIDNSGQVDADETPEEDPEAPPRTDLSLELRARKVHESHHPLSWIASAVTFTVLPGLSETTFAQDVEIRDGTGFLLVSDSMEGRIVRKVGAGPWFGNKILDLVARDKDEKLGIGSAYRELSRDLYQQLSQHTFNAKMQWEVLQEAELRAAPRAPE